jgi:hypothetical protein
MPTRSQFMRDTAVFYGHSPAQLFFSLPALVAPLSAPVGRLRFVPTEVEDNGWSYEPSVAAL